MTTDTIGGVWTYAVELARALAPAGVTVALATMGAPLSAAHRRQVRGLGNVVVHESSYKLEWMPEPWEDVRAAGEWLLEIERAFEPDVVHLNGYAHGRLPFGAPKLVVGHSCVLSWWEAVKGEAAPASWDQYRQHVAEGLRAADVVIAPTRAMLEALLRHYGPLGRAAVIANGRDASIFRNDLQKENLIFSAGRLWDEAKNVAALAEIAPALPWPVYVAGEDVHPDGGRRANEHVKMLGRLDEDELAGWLGVASIYALPARYEPFGLSALEAALCGCALVLGDIPSLREVWDDAALYVPPNDSGALREALVGLIHFRAARADLARRAYARATEYTPRRMAEGYLGAYRQLVASRAKARPEFVA